MSMIHFVGGEKGGVGKSVLSRLLSQYFLDNGIPYAGVDADQSHATLSRYYTEYTQPVTLDHFESIDKIMELALEEDRHVLIDLPAQSQRFLDRWIVDNGVIDLCHDMNISLVYWYTVDGGPDSVNLLNDFLNKYQKQLNIIVAKNQGCGSDFSSIEALPQFTQGELVTAKVRQFYLPGLHAPTMHRIEKLGLSFWAAANLKDSAGEHLGLMERQRSKVWANKAFRALGEMISEIEI